MFRNHLAAALRNLSRHKLYAALNIGGLAIGFAAAMLIALYVRNELTFDRFIPDADHIYDIYTVFDLPGRAPLVADATPGDFAALLRTDFPFIPAITQLKPSRTGTKQGEVYGADRIYWAQPNVFSVLRLPAFAGDLQSALLKPDTLVLTRSAARRYFGRDDALGETLTFVGPDLIPHPMLVTAILQDFPPNTNLNAEIFASGAGGSNELTQADEPQPGFGTNVQIFLKLQPGPDMQRLLREMHDFVHRHKNFRPSDGEIRLELHPLTAIHLTPSEIAYFRPYTNPVVLYALPWVGLLILLVVGINFINLMTARASRRSVEIGIRKACGSLRSHLIVQFLGESVLYAALGMLLAIMLAELSLPAFNAFLDRSIVFHYWSDPALGFSILALVLLFGTLAGAYPAFVLASFRPVATLQSTGGPMKSGSGRYRLVIAQFAVLIALLVMTAVDFRQTSYALNQALGFDKSRVVMIQPNRAFDAPPVPDAYVNALRQLPGVAEVTASGPWALGQGQLQTPVTRADGSSVSLFQAAVDFGFLEFYARKPLAGRFFSRSFGSDAAPRDPKAPWHPPVVINERAAHLLGFATPQSAIGQRITLSLHQGASVADVIDGATPSEIVGVAPDMNFRTVRDPVNPMVYYADPYDDLLYSIRLRAHQIPETLRAMDDLGKRLAGPYEPPRWFLDRALQSQYADVMRQGTLFAIFCGVAAIVSCLGLFGLAAFTAERRTKEIGIRKALGATRSNVLAMLLWQFSKPVLWANLIAWPVAAIAMNRWLHGFAYHIDLEAWLFFAAAAVALMIALATVGIHSMSVARSKPATALRYE
jgi:putative ABC transport system permease protein